MTNEPKMAPSAPASDPANQSDKSAQEAKPAVIVTPAPAPAAAPIETKTT
jgi:hypothetical protein